MTKRLFLLDGLALVYRAHFALASRPVFTSTGVNSSALFGFTQTLLEILAEEQPTHLGVAFDTATPTERHRIYPEYKAHREVMPEDIAAALPHVRRLIDALRIPTLVREGYEADDVIGTLVRRAEAAGFESHMVTPDKDFAQLVTPRVFLHRPGRMARQKEILGPDQVRRKWGVEQPAQVADVLGLWGDASDNIPGVPGIGERTASRLIAQYGSVENLLAHLSDLKGRLRENLERHGDQALLSKRLATIDCAVPIDIDFENLKLRPPDEPALKNILAEFEFHSIGRRLFGDDFRPQLPTESSVQPELPPPSSTQPARVDEGPVRSEAGLADAGCAPARPSTKLRCLSDHTHRYSQGRDREELRRMVEAIRSVGRVALAIRVDGNDPRASGLVGLAFSVEPGVGWYVPWPSGTFGEDEAARDHLRCLVEDPGIEKIGYDLKFVMGVLKAHGLALRGRLFDVLLAHALVEPDLRHSPAHLTESLLGYRLLGDGESVIRQAELDLDGTDLSRVDEETVELADLYGQLRGVLETQLEERNQGRVFQEIEMPLVPVLVAMESEGIRIDVVALGEFAGLLQGRMNEQEAIIHRMAGVPFNVHSPRQLGQVLFERLGLSDKPKRTRTGQYATDETTLATLASQHEIVRHLLEHRACSKLKSTYADALPLAVDRRTGRVHTTYQQLATATGRLNSLNPNLQNIPIRTDLGQEIRKAFVPRDNRHALMSADYSQIELRILASLAREPGLIDAFQSGADVHTATAARVFGVSEGGVTAEMRKQAKMVNYGIAYGISAFGLAQRLGIPRKAASSIIDHYFAQFPGIRDYMRRTIDFAREHGYVETVTGRRRYLRDIQSANATVRGAAERNAINAPVQGTAADMIKVAMVAIQRVFEKQGYRSRMLLQVHDELVFDLHLDEQAVVLPLVEEKMRTAIPLEVPVVVELGVGRNWLEAH